MHEPDDGHRPHVLEPRWRQRQPSGVQEDEQHDAEGGGEAGDAQRPDEPRGDEGDDILGEVRVDEQEDGAGGGEGEDHEVEGDGGLAHGAPGSSLEQSPGHDVGGDDADGQEGQGEEVHVQRPRLFPH